MQSQHRALQGALRREARAAAQGKHLGEELKELQDLLRRRDMDNQRSKMIIRLKEDKIARLEVLPGHPASCAQGLGFRVYRQAVVQDVCLSQGRQDCAAGSAAWATSPLCSGSSDQGAWTTSGPRFSICLQEDNIVWPKLLCGLS